MFDGGYLRLPVQIAGMEGSWDTCGNRGIVGGAVAEAGYGLGLRDPAMRAADPEVLYAGGRDVVLGFHTAKLCAADNGRGG